MKILVTGDLVIKQSYPITKISTEVLNTFKSSDINIVNLEAPVTESSSKILKTGPYHKAQKDSTKGVLEALNIKLCTLANNHILDYDEQGVLDTIEFCRILNIETVGAGKNKAEAASIFYFSAKVGKIAVINIAENEWASATDCTAGANGMDLISDTLKIQEARENADYVFVIVHGGHEHYNLPSPRMQKQYRYYATQGADIVIAHHTHCISGFEIYNGIPIYYSLGNFLFTKHKNKEDWYIGLVLDIEIKNGVLNTKLIPVRQDRESFDLDFLDEDDSQKVLERIDHYNRIIDDPSALQREWEDYLRLKSRIYLNCWSPAAFVDYKYLPAILNKLKVVFSNKKGASLFLNLMRCEAHHDISKEIITKYLRQ